MNKVIIIEGIDGSGTSTITNALHEKIGGTLFDTPINEEFTQLYRETIGKETLSIQDKHFAFSLMVEDKLKAVHPEGRIMQALSEGHVILTRFIDALYVYQGDCFPNLFSTSYNTVKRAVEHYINTQIITVYLVVPPEVAKERVSTSLNHNEAFDTQQEMLSKRYEKVIKHHMTYSHGAKLMEKFNPRKLLNENGYCVFPISREYSNIIDIGVIIDGTLTVDAIITIIDNILNRID